MKLELKICRYCGKPITDKNEMVKVPKKDGSYDYYHDICAEELQDWAESWESEGGEDE